ncbi:Ankyrin repeat-containing domain [Penicillium camemberti]|uniref:Ankyrin repeat-containing domain n=1 Tax=Penicillium camemberti (strain FM 013) TaxID=1429867 RepID=A0A0G4PJ82_PENC3|nr:Ankyrin repeat-containing domain [Penicillium camemberti]
MASRLGLEAVVEILLESQLQNCDARGGIRSRTPLSHAAEAGHENVVKLLLDTRQVDVDSRDSQQRTPLAYAAERGDAMVVQLLLDTGKVDVDFQDITHRTPLSYAKWNGDKKVIQMLELYKNRGRADQDHTTRSSIEDSHVR